MEDFLNKRWNWEKPILISPQKIMDKDACVIPFKKGYIFFHRINTEIWIDVRSTLNFQKDEWILGKLWIKPRERFWDSKKIGIAAPPLRIEERWLLIYHGVSGKNGTYKLGVMILDKDDPRKMLYHYKDTILEPKEDYELYGQIPKVVFSCGAVAIEDKLLVYYGGADTVVGVASCNLKELVQNLK